MKISRKWLQTYFDTELPSTEEIVDALTFHVAEIESVEKIVNQSRDEVLDVKVLPDRAAYLFCHRGVAKEISAILDVPMRNDPLREPLHEYPKTNKLAIKIQDSQKCPRYIGALVRGIKVAPSPTWLKEALESVGQRSINNVVDATNYVMLNIGQPLHAFDASHMATNDGTYAIEVRAAYKDEKIMALTGEEYILPEDTILITDSFAGKSIGIAGIKGGLSSGISETTTDIIIESANFDGTSIRRASQALKLWTDASQRFQNRPSPDLAAYGMRDVLALIKSIAGGEVVGVTDVYPGEGAEQARQASTVIVSSQIINGLLGSTFSNEDIANTWRGLGFEYEQTGDSFTITPPFERRDLVIPEDLVEEVGRIIGYDRILPRQLPPMPKAPDQIRFQSIEYIKDFLTEHGFTELSTQTFTREGDVWLANPLDQTRPALRTTLTGNMHEALSRAITIAPRIYGAAENLCLFEIGTIFKSESECLSLCLGYAQLAGKDGSDFLMQVIAQMKERFNLGDFEDQRESNTLIASTILTNEQLNAIVKNDSVAASQLKRVALGGFIPFSMYPFALRDIAVWTPVGTQENEISSAITTEAGDLLVRIDLFDRFEKKDAQGVASRASYAFRLVFESPKRTLSDEDLKPLMERITKALNAREGWEVR